MEASKDIAVGIPTLNGPERLERCLKSVAKHMPSPSLSVAVLVCDDGSRPECLRKNKAIAAAYGAVFIPHEDRRGVPSAWNTLSQHGIQSMGVKAVALINDDVEVVPDWLDVLAFSVLENPHVGMVGLNAWPGVTSDIFTPRVPDYNEAVLSHGRGLLSSCGYCFAFSSEKYLAVGGFDTRYFCFYEEVDLGTAFSNRGWPSYMASYPIVLHQGGATTSVLSNVDAVARLAESRVKFQEKWGSVEAQRRLILGVKWPDCVYWNTGLKRLTT